MNGIATAARASRRATLVCVSPYVLHRDARFWERPHEFDPDRFSEARSADRPDYAYIPFSGGPRHCIGQHELRLEQRKDIADALPLPASKRKVRESRQAPRQPVEPALGPKRPRLVEKARVVMNRPLTHQHRVPATNLVTANDNVA